MTRWCGRYVLRRLLIDRTTISAIAVELGVFRHTVSMIAMRATADPVAAAGADRSGAIARHGGGPLGLSTGHLLVRHRRRTRDGRRPLHVPA